jgi:GAF domain-containing protein
MSDFSEKRGNYRRFSDRRVALLLDLYETLYHEPAGQERDRRLLNLMQENYGTDQAAFVTLANPQTGAARITATAGKWAVEVEDTPLHGEGVSTLLDLHQQAPGALTLTRVKRPPVFPRKAWENLWEVTLPAKMAILSVRLTPDKAPAEVLWLLQSNYSREWSSRDRDLAEEVSGLFSTARDKAAR